MRLWTEEGAGPVFGILHYIWVHGIQMDSRPSQGCWHIMVMNQSCVLFVTRTTSLPTPSDTFWECISIGHLLRVHQHEIGLDRTRLDSVDQLLTWIADCNIQFLYKFRKLFLPFWVSYMYTVVLLVGLYRWTLNLACRECVCVMQCSRVAGCSFLVLTAVFFFFYIPFFLSTLAWCCQASLSLMEPRFSVPDFVFEMESLGLRLGFT